MTSLVRILVVGMLAASANAQQVKEPSKGLETDAWVGIGNVLKEFKASSWGYRFATPPDDSNPPIGDKGGEARIEMLEKCPCQLVVAGPRRHYVYQRYTLTR